MTVAISVTALRHSSKQQRYFVPRTNIAKKALVRDSVAVVFDDPAPRDLVVL